ncbi:methyltransferase domain-containing protein [Chishuiella sp.]|uniref:methyltransferase domain-containing protein n=1 Tax=Chishuiella sp. TaxID=1969467 RepID=UPI0028A59672|nr:methyltransferase domain-containing protein [Chishuiella sp.]
MSLDEKFWNDKYENNDIKWDLKSPSQPLKEYIDQLQNKDLKILIPGCGNAYEAEYLLEKGFKNIVLVDISEVVVQQLKQKFRNNNHITILHQDFFTLKNQFDLILEQTFFCALNPNLRIAYVQQMHRLLSENGKLVGVLFNRQFNNIKPPYGGHLEEYKLYFKEFFILEKMEECYNSILPRKGTELFIHLLKK